MAKDTDKSIGTLMESLIQSSQYLVQVFDQANTNGEVCGIGRRGVILEEAVTEVCEALRALGVDPFADTPGSEWRERRG